MAKKGEPHSRSTKTTTVARPTKPACNTTQDELQYFSFFQGAIFCFFLASDKFILVDYIHYAPSVLPAILASQTLTHGFSINVIILSILESYLSNAFSHTLCKRRRYLELNSFLATLSLVTLSGVSTLGSLGGGENYGVNIRDAAPAVITAWCLTKTLLVINIGHILYERCR
jgi:hypothetical protein